MENYKELVERLKDLEAIAYGYNINGEVLGMDCSDFEQIMVDAATAITELLSRAEKAEREMDAIMQDISGICYLCKNGNPFGKSEGLRICEHFKGRATNREKNCPHFEYRGNMEE